MSSSNISTWFLIYLLCLLPILFYKVRYHIKNLKETRETLDSGQVQDPKDRAQYEDSMSEDRETSWVVGGCILFTILYLFYEVANHGTLNTLQALLHMFEQQIISHYPRP